MPGRQQRWPAHRRTACTTRRLGVGAAARGRRAASPAGAPKKGSARRAWPDAVAPHTQRGRPAEPSVESWGFGPREC
eukprot:4197612-Prymnesium_polylepis.1